MIVLESGIATVTRSGTTNTRYLTLIPRDLPAAHTRMHTHKRTRTHRVRKELNCEYKKNEGRLFQQVLQKGHTRTYQRLRHKAAFVKTHQYKYQQPMMVLLCLLPYIVYKNSYSYVTVQVRGLFNQYRACNFKLVVTNILNAFIMNFFIIGLLSKL